MLVDEGRGCVKNYSEDSDLGNRVDGGDIC